MANNINDLARQIEAELNSDRVKKQLDQEIKKLPPNKRKGLAHRSNPDIMAYGEQLGRQLIDLIVHDAELNGVPESVVAHIKNAKIMSKMGKDGLNIYIYFEEDKRRISMYDQNLYIKNIVALFNNGYEARATVRGTWDTYDKKMIAEGKDSHWIASHPAISRQSRPPIGFIQNGVEQFLAIQGLSDDDLFVLIDTDYKLE